MATSSRTAQFVSIDLVLRCLLAAALLLLAWFSVWPLMPPAAAPASADKGNFSAVRAMADLSIVAREPHGAGSAAQARVRDYILAQASAAGLQGEVQKAVGIENVLVRLPGTASTGLVVITGHYDSHAPAPGAGDNGISVAAMLEAMRTLSVGPAPRNNTLFLFTDGEEMGWLGALAFISSAAKAERAATVVLCFDARPGNGPLTVRETSPGDGWLVEQLAAARAPLWAASWLNADERTDTDTDFTVFSPAGFKGFEIENVARGTLYHTTADTPEAIAPAMVQAYGEAMIRLARQFGGVNLSAAGTAPDVIYFSVPPYNLVYYPSWVDPAVAALAMVGIAGLAAVAWRRQQFSLVRGLLGALAWLGVLIIIVLLATGLWSLLLATRPVSWEMTLNYPDFAGSGWWIVGIMAGAIGLAVGAVYGLSSRISAVSLSVGGLLVYLLVWWVAYFFLDSQNPLTTAYLVWPLVGGVAGLAVSTFVRRSIWAAALLFVAAIPVVVLLVPMLLPLVLQPPSDVWVPVLATGLALGLLAPQIAFIAGRLAAAPAN